MLRSALDWVKTRAGHSGRDGESALLRRYLAGGAREGLDTLLRSTRLREFVRDHRAPLLQDFLRAGFGDLDLLSAEGPVFARLCELARRAGVQEDAAASLAPLLPPLAHARPDLIGEALSLMVGAIDENAFDASIAAVHAAGAGQALVPFADYPSIRGSAPDSIAVRLLSAIERGEIGAVLVALLDEGEGTLGVDGLIDLLRAHSHAVAALAPKISDWPHHEADSGALLKLAVTLGDQAGALRHLDAAPGDEIRALALRATGDLAAFDRFYADLARADGVRPIRFKGSGLAALFANIIDSDEARGTGADGPLVSVIVTAHDPDPELLALSLRSVLVQRHPALEILLVDDHSADGGAAVDKVAALDPRIRTVRTDRNGGPYAARNLALGYARGDFVAIQDADDVSHPDRLARQVAAFIADDQLVACSSRALRFDVDGRLQLGHDGRLFSDGTMSTMFRRSVFQRLGGFAAVRSRGDVEFRERIRRTLGDGALATIACPLVFCASSPNSLSNVVQRDLGWALRALRRNFMLLEWRADGDRFVPLGPLVVPWPLRP